MQVQFGEEVGEVVASAGRQRGEQHDHRPVAARRREGAVAMSYGGGAVPVIVYYDIGVWGFTVCLCAETFCQARGRSFDERR